MPAPQTITTLPWQTNRVLAIYKTWGRMQSLGGKAFQPTGSTGTVYRIESSPRLGTNAVWSTVRLVTNNAASTSVSDLPTSPSNTFIRAVLVP